MRVYVDTLRVGQSIFTESDGTERFVTIAEVSHYADAEDMSVRFVGDTEWTNFHYSQTVTVFTG